MMLVFSYILGRASEMFAYNDGKLTKILYFRGETGVFWWKGTAVSNGIVAVR